MIESDQREAGLRKFDTRPALDDRQNADGAEPPKKTKNDSAASDHELLSAYVQGDESAFEALVEKYFRLVYTVAGRHTSDWHLAEEIAQSVFLILSRKAHGFSTKTHLPGWLIQTTRFVCWDAIRMRRRRDQNERKFAVNLAPQVEPGPEPSRMELLLEEALRALRPDEHAGIVARFFEGKDFPEIAAMFAISEHAARKRTSRCLAKLQTFMAKRGVKVALPTLAGLLVLRPAEAATNQALQSMIQASHAVWKGKIADQTAATLADHTLRRLRWRFLVGLGLSLSLSLVMVFLGVWSVRNWDRLTPDRIERLGRDWGALDQRVAQHRQYLIQTPPNTPNFQETILQELGAIGRESARIIDELKRFVAPPAERTQIARFLTAELDKTLNLSPSQKATLFSYIQNRLAQGATLNDALKALAQTTQSEAADIKAMLSPVQRARFDQVYGADGVLLFSYAKAVALKQIGP